MSIEPNSLKLHFPIERYHIVKVNVQHTVTEATAKLLKLSGNNVCMCTGTVQQLNVSGTTSTGYEKMDLYLFQGGADKTHFLITYHKDFDSKKFIEVFNSAINDVYNEVHPATLQEAEGYYGGERTLTVTFSSKDKISIFELFKKLLVSSCSSSNCQSRWENRSPVQVEKELDEFFGIASFKKEVAEKARKEEEERLFKENQFDALYDMLVEDCRHSSRKGIFLRYGIRLHKEGNFAEAIRFLNAEHPVHGDTHDKAQREVFNVLGTLLQQDEEQKFLTPQERRDYLRNRIQLAYRLEEKHPDLQGVTNKLFSEYAGFSALGVNVPTFDLHSDLMTLAFQLADELHKSRTLANHPESQD